MAKLKLYWQSYYCDLIGSQCSIACCPGNAQGCPGLVTPLAGRNIWAFFYSNFTMVLKKTFGMLKMYNTVHCISTLLFILQYASYTYVHAYRSTFMHAFLAQKKWAFKNFRFFLTLSVTHLYGSSGLRICLATFQLFCCPNVTHVMPPLILFRGIAIRT